MSSMPASFKWGAKVYPSTGEKRFLPYQKAWIEDNSRLKIMEKSRQVGVSWSTAYKCVRDIGMQGNRQDIWVSSRDDIQAKLFLNDCKAFAKVLNCVVKDMGETLLVDGKKSWTVQTLTFSNDKIIYSLSSNPDAQAGKRGTRVLDEFALHRDPKLLYAIALPGITWGGRLEIISTHRGGQNFFNKLVEEAKGTNKRKLSLHTVTLQNALDQGFLYKLQTKLGAGIESLDDLPEDDSRREILECDEAAYFQLAKDSAADEESFLQEYMCVPSDDSTTFLPYEILDPCQYPHGTDWQKPLEDCEELYVGVDIGRKKDLTVIWVMEKSASMNYTRRLIVLEKMPYSQQEDILYPILGLKNMRRCCIDASGIGSQFAERAAERFGTYRVEGVTLTNKSKEELAYPFRTAFEDRTIRIPNDQKLYKDLRGVKKETTLNGLIRFAADHGPDGHSDRFWAGALAIHAGKNPEYHHVTAVNLGGLRTLSSRDF